MRQNYRERVKIHSVGWRGQSVSPCFQLGLKNIPKVRGIWQRLALKSLYQLAGPDWPPVVADQENKWVIREGIRRARGPA
jgi:hypothetical protein